MTHHRLRAWLLLVLFLSAGTSLPGADALFNHRHPEPFRVHFDPAGGCGEHADHCTLGRTPPGSRAMAPVVVDDRAGFHCRPHAVRIPLARRPDAQISLLPHSRAPPAPLT